jgi:inner membrane protein involved in colicin E2 resistance
MLRLAVVLLLASTVFYFGVRAFDYELTFGQAVVAAVLVATVGLLTKGEIDVNVTLTLKEDDKSAASHLRQSRKEER